MRFVADVNASGIGMDYVQTEVFALHLPLISRHCFRFISCQGLGVGGSVTFSVFFWGLDFMLSSPA
jgi:hypothetical protein